MKQFFRDYAKHTALNLGQAARDLRFFYYHPGADKLAKEGSLRHAALSAPRRTKSLANNLLFSALPPQLHHSPKELSTMKSGSHAAWFLYGYMPWKYPDPARRP